MNTELYPHPDDPRRFEDWGTRTVEAEMRALLGAILTQLYAMGEQLSTLEGYVESIKYK